MLRSLSRWSVRSAAVLLALVPPAAAQAALDSLAGTWDGTCEPPGVVGGDPFSLVIDSVEGAAVHGAFVFPGGSVPFDGTFEPARHTLTTSLVDGTETVTSELVLADGTLAGHGLQGRAEWGFRVKRASAEVLARSHAPRTVDLAAAERPETFSLVGLETELGFQLDE